MTTLLIRNPGNLRGSILKLSAMRRVRQSMILLAGFLACAIAVTAVPQPQNPPVRDGRWAILVMGISGDPELQVGYLKELEDLRAVLEKQLAFPRDHVIALFDDPKFDPTNIQYQSTRANLEMVCKGLAGKVGKEDLVFVFLQGHGDSDGKVYRLNLVGPDPTGVDLANMLYSIPAGRFIIVNATNCSGGSLEALSGKGRIILSATKSGTEKNFTHFGKFFIDALAANNADIDKNGRVSMFEAFGYASRKIEEYYTKEGAMQSEHPVLSDNGDAKAVALDDTADTRTAALARVAYLDRGLFAIQGDMSPEAQALAREAQSLEKQIEILKSAKDEMSAADYDKKLEELLLKLAETQAKLRKK
jgi:hypothetical protein